MEITLEGRIVGWLILQSNNPGFVKLWRSYFFARNLPVYSTTLWLAKLSGSPTPHFMRGYSYWALNGPSVLAAGFGTP